MALLEAEKVRLLAEEVLRRLDLAFLLVLLTRQVEVEDADSVHHLLHLVFDPRLISHVYPLSNLLFPHRTQLKRHSIIKIMVLATLLRSDLRKLVHAL